MASVLPRRSAAGVVTWRVQFRHDGKHAQRTFEKKQGADEFGALIDRLGADAALHVLETRSKNTAASPTLREWVERYIDASSGLLTGIEPGTRRGYLQAARNSFLKFLGDYPVDAVTRADVGRWVAWQEQQESHRQPGRMIAPKTVKNYHSLLSAAFSCAVDEGLRTDNPAYRTKLTRGIAHEGVFLSHDEFATLLFFMPQEATGFVYFLAGTGCRWGEATALTWADYTPARPASAANPRGAAATIRISKAWKKSTTGAPVLKQPKSMRGRRTISIPPDVVHAMGKPGHGDQLIFAGPLSGKHLWYGRFRTTTWDPAVTKAMDRDLCAEHGLTQIVRRPTIHSLRHTHASWLVAAGTPLPNVQARLGHESIQTTSNTYTHLLPDAHEEMAAITAQQMSGTFPLRELETMA